MFLLIIIIIISINYFLLHFPNIIARFNGSNSKLKKNKQVLGHGKGCLHISHRGGSDEAPENTILAFEHSINNCNTDMLETDVWLTKDNVLVVLHDENLLNICGINKSVNEFCYAELPLTKNSDNLMPSSDYLNPALWKGYPTKFSGQKLTTLEELFQRYPDILISVDIKNNCNKTAVYKTVELVRKYKREDKTMLCSFCDENVYLLKKFNHNQNDPELIICVARKKLLLILISYLIGFLPWLYIDEHVVSFPLSSNFFSNYAKSFVNKIEKYITIDKYYKNYIEETLIPNILFWLFTRKLLFKHLQKRGIRCFAWVCNNINEINICRDLDLDGIVTDKPTLLRVYYDKHKIKSFK